MRHPPIRQKKHIIMEWAEESCQALLLVVSLLLDSSIALRCVSGFTTTSTMVTTRRGTQTVAAMKSSASDADAHKKKSPVTGANVKKTKPTAGKRTRPAKSSVETKAMNAKEKATKATSKATKAKEKATKAQAKSTTANNTKNSPQPLTTVNGRRLLFRLEDTNKHPLTADAFVTGTLVCRPSQRNRSPYVADVNIDGNNDNDTAQQHPRTVIAHVPNLDMGGKCTMGSRLVLRYATDACGQFVGPDAVNPKYGTPKCECIAQLVQGNDEQYSNSNIQYSNAWIGAHPRLGECIAEAWLKHCPHVLFDTTDAANTKDHDIIKIESQVTNPGGVDPHMRSDFLISHAHGQYQTVVEVKTVVDTDYAAGAGPQETDIEGSTPTKTKKKKKQRPVFWNHKLPYRRTALFPWGASKQTGPEGEAVVSARAIRHVRKLTELQQQNQKNTKIKSLILFVVIRDDAEIFSPNVEACPSFARYLKEAADAGVRIVARSVEWGQWNNTTNSAAATATANASPSNSSWCCWDGKALPIRWPSVGDDKSRQS